MSDTRALPESSVERLEWTLRRTLSAARLVPTPLPLCPELQCHLLDPDNMQRPFTGDEVQAVLDNTPYWIFCWAGGQALAHYVLRARDRVAGRCVLDFGSGSGVVAIAAALAGAARVIACDIDPDAILAIEANAALNRVELEICTDPVGLAGQIDLIIAADVLYDRDNRHYLDEFLKLAPRVLVADSRARSIEVPPYRKIAEIRSHTLPTLGGPDDDDRWIAIYQAERGEPNFPAPV